MASPSTLSLSSTFPLSLSHHHHSSLSYRTKTHITCNSDEAGTGTAAPTRADIFLRHLEKETTQNEPKLVVKKKKNKLLKREKASGYGCYGCGAPLQLSETDAPGFVDKDTYALKKKHHQLRQVLCGRCQLLSHGHMITAVGGNGGYSGGKQFVSAEELRDKLSHLRFEKALIVKLVDIVDFNGSFLARVRDLAGANPIMLVITKGRDVYILGSANVGKSAFISALLQMLSYKDPVAAAAQKYKPIQSAVPGTTLGPIQINCFLGGGKVFDTPGVHLHHRQAAVIHSEDLPVLAPKSRLRGQSFPIRQVDLDGQTANRIGTNGLKGFSIFWGGLVRVDVLEVLPETCLTFYGPKALKIHMVPTYKADEFYQREVGTLLTPPSTKEKADSWAGLQIRRDLEIKFEDVERPACDVAISGLGWIAVEPMGRAYGVLNSDLEQSDKKELRFAVHVPKPVEIFVRSPLPVGKNGQEWYQYRDLTEKEEEVRPKWYF